MSSGKKRRAKKGRPNPSKSQPQHFPLTEIRTSALTEKRWHRILRNLHGIPRALGRICGWLWSRIPFEKVAVWASIVMTLVAGAFYFLPRVTIDPSGAYDPSNPSPITFTISNINIVPLRDVQVAICLCYIKAPAGSPQIEFRGAEAGRGETPIECNGPAGAKVAGPWFVRWLDTDERYQVALEDAVRLAQIRQSERANITIAVIYSPWWMPWRATKEFRFVAKRRSDGKIYWTPTPLNR
jgi:hypothetical protein